MKIKKNDIVKIIAGKYKGKEGKVLKALPKIRKVFVENIGIFKKHIKPQLSKKYPEGGIIEKYRFIDISNVMLIVKKINRPVRVGYSIDKNSKKNRSVRGRNLKCEIIN